MKFHVNPETGNPGPCTATVQCRFGGDEIHYSTADDARKAYEQVQAALAIPDGARRARSVNQIVGQMPAHELAALDTYIAFEGSKDGINVDASAEDLREYTQVARAWYHLQKGEETYGLSQQDEDKLQEMAASMNTLGRLVGMPTVRDVKQARAYLELEKTDELIHEERTKINESSFLDKDPNTRYVEIKSLRLRMQEATELLREFAPNATIAIDERRVAALDVELKELEAEQAMLGTRPRFHARVYDSEVEDIQRRRLNVETIRNQILAP